MNPKLREVLDMISLEELKKIKKDIEEYKGAHLLKLVKQKIKAKEEKTEVCAVCLSNLMPFSTENYTLNFGPKGFKKKVSLCSNDCLHQFLANMNKSKELHK